MTLNKLGFNIFNRYVFEVFKPSIFEAFRFELDKDRKEQGTNRALLKNQTKIFIELSRHDNP